MKSVTVLKIKIDAEHYETLAAGGLVCRRARNAAAMDWLLRQNGMPESERQRKRLRAMSAKERQAIVSRGKNPDEQEKSEDSKLYAAVTDKVPELNCTVAGMISRSVASYLSAKVDWRRGMTDGKRARRRDAILAGTDRPPYFTTTEIPIRSRDVEIKFTDRLTFVLPPILSGEGRLWIVCSVRKMPPGMQRIIRDLAEGKRKLADLKAVCKDDAWYFHIPVQFETEPLSDREAVLYPVLRGEKTGKRFDPFFRLELPGRRWYAGDGAYLLAQTHRYTGLRKQIGWRYRFRQGAGHGRGKVDAAVSRRYEQEFNMRSEVRWRAIADIIRTCERDSIGKIIYREPSLPLRDKTWFAERGLEWDWTDFLTKLKNAAARRGIDVSVTPWKFKEAMAGKESPQDLEPVGV